MKKLLFLVIAFLAVAISANAEQKESNLIFGKYKVLSMQEDSTTVYALAKENGKRITPFAYTLHSEQGQRPTSSTA